MDGEDVRQPLVAQSAVRAVDRKYKWVQSALVFLSGVVLTLLVLAGAQQMMSGAVEHRGEAGSSRDTCTSYLGTDVQDQFSVILTADPGDFSGTPEARFIVANLENRHTKPRSQTVCAGHNWGILMGQLVLVVTTGIGPPAAGLCTLEVLTACGPYVKDMVYFGTSGWSPAKGGILNPPACTEPNQDAEPNRLGDVCVSPFSVNWTCKKATWEMQAAGYPNQCVLPQEVTSPNATYLYGECQFYRDNMEANLELSDAVMRAAKVVLERGGAPPRTAAVTAVEAEYWGAMRNATGVQFPPLDPHGVPRLRDYTECMEVDGQFFYSGAPWEAVARGYVAQTLTAAGVAVTGRDVIAVSAMEAIGVAEALLKHRVLSSTTRKVPYTNVRALSNWLHQPVTQVSPGAWEVATELAEDFVTGYGYAIATGSATIMSLFQARCEDEKAASQIPPSTDCSFTIDTGVSSHRYESTSSGSAMRHKERVAGLRQQEVVVPQPVVGASRQVGSRAGRQGVRPLLNKGVPL